MSACLLVLAWLAAASAHELTDNAARVALRDGHVDVRLDVDVGPWLALMAEGEPAERIAAAQRVLIEESRLTIDGEPVLFERLRMPDTSELVADLAAFEAGTHGHRREVHLEARAPATAAGLELSLPASLGPVVVTFVQPQTRWTAPGAPAAFVVLQSPEP